MYDVEFERLKRDYSKLSLEDDANRELLENKLTTTISIALPKDDAKRFIGQIKQINFYPLMFVIDNGDGYSPDIKTWNEGIRRMIALIESVEYNLQMLETVSTKRQDERRPSSDHVFIVHGHDEAILRDVEAFVRRIGVTPIILMDEPSQGGTVVEKFERHADVPFAIVLLSPDDVGRANGAPEDKLKRRPRQNAVFELGFFIGRLGRENTVMFVDSTLNEEVEYPSDLGGIVSIYYKRDNDWKTRLMREFRASRIDHDARKA